MNFLIFTWIKQIIFEGLYDKRVINWHIKISGTGRKLRLLQQEEEKNEGSKSYEIKKEKEKEVKKGTLTEILKKKNL